MNRLNRLAAVVCLLSLAPLHAATAQQLAPLKYNGDRLVMMAVEGVIAPPTFGEPPYRINPDGKAGVLPGTGSITYNFRTGDSAVRIAGDHVEPAVSIYNLGAQGDRSSGESRALNVLSCIGNEATVISGDAKGKQGRVIGKHGGAEHVMVDFAEDVFDDLAIGDRIHIRSIGVGLELMNADGVHAMNVSPELLDAFTRAGAGVTKGGRLRIGVTHRIPAKIMGSGLGRSHVYRGDYDIQLFDEKTFAEHGLGTLRFGDIVALTDADTTFGRTWRDGAITVGVVVHSRSQVAGHGPGVVTLFTSREGRIDTVIDPDANLKSLLDMP